MGEGVAEAEEALVADRMGLALVSRIVEEGADGAEVVLAVRPPYPSAGRRWSQTITAKEQGRVVAEAVVVDAENLSAKQYRIEPTSFARDTFSEGCRRRG